jgi:hypothetical protein
MAPVTSTVDDFVNVGITARDLVNGAQDACDKRNDPSVSYALWVRYLNQGIKALFRKVAAQFADTWLKTVDFTLTGGQGGNTYAFSSDFESLRHLTQDPTTTARRAIRPFNLQEVDRFRGDPVYKIMGRTLYLEPPENAAGNFRAWYTPRPTLLQIDNVIDYATVAALPAYTHAGSGPGATLTATVNGALTLVVQGSPPVNSVIAVKNEATLARNGFYVLTQAGDASHPWILTRGNIQNGYAVHVASGYEADQLFISSIAGADDVANFAWNAQQLDDVLAPYEEYVKTYAAALALEKEQSDSSQQRQRIQELEEDMQAMIDSQEAGGQVAIADVEQFDITRFRRHPLP